jgi:hypothetical protein
MTVPAPVLPPQDIQLTAENADEMAQCQGALIGWFKAKLVQTQSERFDLEEAYNHARKRKWNTATLKRHAEFAMKRVAFYEKVLGALEHGYQIVPSFPMTAFAVRTSRKNPLKLWTTNYWATHEQPSNSPPQGEGEYKNPFPLLRYREFPTGKPGEPPKKHYFADEWKDLEFPISMAKPRIMEAATRAMALQIFDDLGIVPEKPKADPMIIGRIFQPTNSYAKRSINFIIAWHLDTSTL